jgi:hypothetical protein
MSRCQDIVLVPAMCVVDGDLTASNPASGWFIATTPATPKPGMTRLDCVTHPGHTSGPVSVEVAPAVSGLRGEGRSGSVAGPGGHLVAVLAAAGLAALQCLVAAVVHRVHLLTNHAGRAAQTGQHAPADAVCSAWVRVSGSVPQQPPLDPAAGSMSRLRRVLPSSSAPASARTV